MGYSAARLRSLRGDRRIIPQDRPCFQSRQTTAMAAFRSAGPRSRKRSPPGRASQHIFISQDNLFTAVATIRLQRPGPHRVTHIPLVRHEARSRPPTLRTHDPPPGYLIPLVRVVPRCRRILDEPVMNSAWWSVRVAVTHGRPTI